MKTQEKGPKGFTAAQQNAALAQGVEMVARMIRSGNDLNGKPATAEEIARSLRAFADMVEGK